MIHGQCVLKLHVRSTPDAPFTVIDDLEQCRAILHAFQLPMLKPEYMYAHHHHEGDLACWYNQGCWHSITEFPESYGARIMHQVNLGHTVDPQFIEPLSAVA